MEEVLAWAYKFGVPEKNLKLTWLLPEDLLYYTEPFTKQFWSTSELVAVFAVAVDTTTWLKVIQTLVILEWDFNWLNEVIFAVNFGGSN